MTPAPFAYHRPFDLDDVVDPGSPPCASSRSAQRVLAPVDGGQQATLTLVAFSWITRTHRVVAETIPAAPAQVRAFYVDLANIVQLHPLVVAVRSTARRATEDGYTETFRVHDRIPLAGPVVVPINYRVTLMVPTAGDVTTESRQFPRVRLRSVVSFTATGEGTRVVEDIEIEAPTPLARLTVGQATAAHVEMLAGIRRVFAAS
jgi:hypothetical protein